MKALLAQAFEKWLRREREDPESFTSRHEFGTKPYGEACAAYLLELLGELVAEHPPVDDVVVVRLDSSVGPITITRLLL